MKPIIFTTDEVRATLDERKGMKRIPIEPQPYQYDLSWADNREDIDAVKLGAYKDRRDDRLREALNELNGAHCPHKPKYQPGDILWVRETWQEIFETEYNPQDPANPFNAHDIIRNFDALPKTCAGLSRECSCASMPARNKFYVYAATPPEYTDESYGLYWKPSTQMPCAAARLFLRVTDVRAERVQELSERDAYQEGFVNDGDWSAVTEFADQWDAINAKRKGGIYVWDKSPWVWVISFGRIDRPQGWPEGRAG